MGYVRKRVTSLAIVLKKEKINPRGVASNVERKDIAKPIVLMKPRIKGAVSSAKAKTTWLRNANYPTPVESAKKKVTWPLIVSCPTPAISAKKKVTWPPTAQ